MTGKGHVVRCALLCALGMLPAVVLLSGIHAAVRPTHATPPSNFQSLTFPLQQVESAGTIAAHPRGSEEEFNDSPARGETGDTIVYRNVASSGIFFLPRDTALFFADDVSLTQPFGCDMTYYELGVIGTGGGTFDLHVEFWDGDPCFNGNRIADTAADFQNIPANGQIQFVRRNFPRTVGIPGNIWVQTIFSSPNAGWVFGERAEIGFTDNFFSSDGPGANDCRLYRFGQGPPFPYSGFWTEIACDLTPRPPGACCVNQSCTQRLERECEGIWRGPLTGCTPNPCGQRVTIYENRFNTGSFLRLEGGTRVADDFRFATGPLPCQLATFELAVTGLNTTPPFDVILELWTNHRGADGVESGDDLPAQPIPGTRKVFTSIPADQFAHVLSVGPIPAGTIMSEKTWVVVSTSTPSSGPLLAGLGDVGVSEDRFARQVGGTWVPETLDGFNPATCPGGAQCRPAGSFRARVVCFGESAQGACCEPLFFPSCTDAVRIRSCTGDWLADTTCSPDPFDPPCESACPATGSLAFIDPPTGVVDARQPHAINAPSNKDGIKRFRLLAPPGSPFECFRFCETQANGDPNEILAIEEPQPGSYELRLSRSLTANALAEIWLADLEETGEFFFHPGNVNGNQFAGPDDISALVSCLLNVAPLQNCPHGFPYSQDLNRDGFFDLLDLPTLIDLLNGAGDFIPQLGTPLPTGSCR